MKRARNLAVEPPLLAQYRATYPREDTRPKEEASATWEDFKTDQPAYKELLAKLAEAQQGLCLYCEERLVDDVGTLVANDYQVEHVEAKSGAVGRVLNWSNLALACGGGTYPQHSDPTRKYTTVDNTSCGQTKGDKDLPQNCDPRTFPLLDSLVDVNLDGELLVNASHCTKAGVKDQDVNKAIAILNLNCERLRKARQDCRDNINKWFLSLLNELHAGTHLSPMQRQQMLDLLIAGRLQPDRLGYLRAWWTAERSALDPDATTWISYNQGLF